MTNNRISSQINSGAQAYAAYADAGVQACAAAAPPAPDRQQECRGKLAAGQDQVEISDEGRRAGEERASFDQDTVWKMEAAIANADLRALRDAARERCGKLEVNWDRVMDPDGKIYGAAYVESILRQYQCAENTIKAYYANAHQENLGFENPYNHIVNKYMLPDSPYFRHDMSKAEREMAFRQERDLLWKGQVALGDPYALAASGGMLKVEEVDRIAHQAARDKIDGLVREYQAKNQDTI